MKKTKSEPAEEHIHIEKKEFPRKAVGVVLNKDGSFSMVEIEYNADTKETGQVTLVPLNPNKMIAKDELRVRMVRLNPEFF